MAALAGRATLRRLNFGRILADIGWQATFVVGVWGQAAFALDGGPAVLAAVTACMTTGWLLGAVAAGRAIDRFGPKAMIVACQLVLAPAVLLLHGVSSTAPLLAVVGLLGLLVAPSYMSLASMAPHLTSEPRDFQRINGSLEVAGTTASILGAAAGALIVRWFGLDWIFVFHAALAVMAAAVIAGITTRPPETRQAPARRLFDGIRTVYADRVLVRYLLASMSVWLTMSIFETLQPIFIRDSLSAGADALGWLHIVFAVGLIAGSSVVGSVRFAQVTTLSLPWWMAMVGVGIAIFASGSMAAAAGGLFMVGVAVGAFEPLLRTGIQARVERNRIGRVVSILEVHDQVAELTPLMVIATVTAAFGVPLVLLVTGLAAAATGLTILGRRLSVDGSR